MKTKKQQFIKKVFLFTIFTIPLFYLFLITPVLYSRAQTITSCFVTNFGNPDNIADLPPECQTTNYVPPAPSSNTCTDKYNFSSWPNKNPVGNFGDPLCNFSKDNLYTQLLANRDGNKVVTNRSAGLNGLKYADVWFHLIIPYEATSSYTPNAFSGITAEQCRLDCGGAWGLFQMGSSTPPGQEPTAPGKNGIYDRGDVNWQVQIGKANDYNTIHLPPHLIWCYWRHARDIGLAQNC